MLSPTERAEYRSIFYDELSRLERLACHHGSYKFVCQLMGGPVLTHTETGTVLRRF